MINIVKLFSLVVEIFYVTVLPGTLFDYAISQWGAKDIATVSVLTIFHYLDYQYFNLQYK